MITIISHVNTSDYWAGYLTLIRGGNITSYNFWTQDQPIIIIITMMIQSEEK